MGSVTWAGRFCDLGTQTSPVCKTGDAASVSMLASETQDRGFDPGRSRRNFRGGGSKTVCPMSQLCDMLKTPVTYVEVEVTGQIDRPFLDRNSVLH
jgi:hypothetical protein